ncbi:MAG: GNAT family N-acetyltransferase, partial [Candidatus Obscuribacterales bacterium]|nr:GNAT family N-acetyltransferase [Candidatus Obscuribacterales bacterium]
YDGMKEPALTRTGEISMFVEVSTAEHAAAVAGLAEEIWTEHYTPIIGRDQVEYMLEKFQSEDAVCMQIRNGYRYFLISEEGRFIGYFAVEPRGRELFLSKIYLRADLRRKGHGRKAIRFLETLAREGGFEKIALTVNKNNKGSIAAYEKIGFRNLGPLLQDIGGGFVMDDYRMEKKV